MKTSRERTGYDVIVICVSCCVDWNDWNRPRFEKASLSTTIYSRRKRVELSAKTIPVPDSWICYKHPN